MSTARIQRSEEPIAVEASRLRREILKAFYACGGGHYGGCLSVLDIILTLYRKFLRVDPECPDHPERDRLVLSKGHAAMALYAVLRNLGFTEEPLAGYGHADSAFEGHPDMTSVPGVDFTTGSLGQGLSVGLGMAVALRHAGRQVWVVLGDGECQEGQVWEAAMVARRYGADNLYAIVDANGHQEWGWNHDDRLDGEPMPQHADKWAAFGWNVLEVDGHDYDAMTSVFADVLSHAGGPSAIVARTVKGKGHSLIESDPVRFHCTQVTEMEQATLLEER